MSILLSLVFVVTAAHAVVDEKSCPDFTDRRDGTNIQQMLAGSGECFFSVGPEDAWQDLVYRDFLFTTSGLVMVFNSYGEGPDSTTTGAREYFMFPRPYQSFKYEWKDDTRELVVTHVTGDQFVFDSKKAHLKSISRATVKVADYVERNNRGGVEISNYQGLLLDGGFRMGASPTSNANGSSVMKDKSNNSCTLKNSELFKYPGGGDSFFKYTDAQLMNFLKKRCPKLVSP